MEVRSFTFHTAKFEKFSQQKCQPTLNGVFVIRIELLITNRHTKKNKENMTLPMLYIV